MSSGRPYLWPRDPSQTASGKVGAVHTRQALEERDGIGQFMGLTRSHDEGHGSSEPIRDHAGLGAIAPARSPKRFTCVPLRLGAPFRLAPAAFWCARMLVPSRNVIPRSTPRS